MSRQAAITASDIAAALIAAQREPGWHGRNPTIRRFDLGGCELIVVPAICWAYRRRDRIAAEWRAEQASS